jgi:hypothetical protein
MKAVFFAIGLLAPALGGAAPNPAEYPIAVHVQASRLLSECDSALNHVVCGKKLHVNVVIEGKKYELDGGIDDRVLHVGDYHAKVTQDYGDAGSEFRREYELLFPDGTKRKFSVVGETE